LTPTDKFADIAGVLLMPNNAVALLYEQRTTASVVEGLRFLTIKTMVAGAVQELAGTSTADAGAGRATLGLDRHGGATIVYVRGAYPDTDFAVIDQLP